MLNGIMLSVVMLSVVMLSVVTLNVVTRMRTQNLKIMSRVFYHCVTGALLFWDNPYLVSKPVNVLFMGT